MNTRTAILLPLVLFVACGSNSSSLPGDEQPATAPSGQKQDLAGLSTAHFAAGCFWCMEEVFQSVKGVKEVISGYSGGTAPNPTYEEVSSGRTSHAEAVEVYYDPKVVSYATLLKVFFASQDPTTPDRQGPDAGTQYRSIAFYNTPERKAQIEAYIKQLNASGQYDRPIVTQVVPFVKFWPAEAYHQDYVRRHPGDPYVQSVSIPRFERFKAKMPEVLK